MTPGVLRMRSLLAPKSVAVVGASPRGGRGADVLANLRNGGFTGDVFAVNPRHAEVQGCKCFATVSDLPAGVDCIVVAVGADAACDVLEEAHARGIAAAVVLASGFGEGGHGEARAQRVRRLAANGMCICGPNCFGLINFNAKVAAFSGGLPRPPRPGRVAMVSQSGGLGATALTSLMGGRALGFGYFVSCGNQLGATIEDFIDYFIDDPDVEVVAILVEALTNPRKLADTARKAHAQRKSLLLYQLGRSSAGQAMIRSHTGSLAGDREILAAFLRRCGIVQAAGYDEFIETIELFATAPRDETLADDVVVLCGSGGGAAMATDALEEAGVRLANSSRRPGARLRSAQPDFASVTNPIDGTGAMYDDPALFRKSSTPCWPGNGDRFAASLTVRAGTSANVRRVAEWIAEAARSTRPHLGDVSIHAARRTARSGDHRGAPWRAGAGPARIFSAMKALRSLSTRRRFWRRHAASMPQPRAASVPLAPRDAAGTSFLAARSALASFGIPVVEAALAGSGEEAVALQRRFGTPVALKAEMPGLLHKSDIGCVRLGCKDASEVAQAYRAIVENARTAGFDTADVLVQPM